MDFTLSTRPEIIDVYLYRKFAKLVFEGKVEILNKFLDKQVFNPDKTWFYSDLKMIYRWWEIDHPVAVHPDQNLRIVAEQAGWKILDKNFKACL